MSDIQVVIRNWRREIRRLRSCSSSTSRQEFMEELSSIWIVERANRKMQWMTQINSYNPNCELSHPEISSAYIRQAVTCQVAITQRVGAPKASFTKWAKKSSLLPSTRCMSSRVWSSHYQLCYSPMKLRFNGVRWRLINCHSTIAHGRING